MLEKSVTLTYIEDNVITRENGETGKTVTTDNEFINYFFFSATSIDYLTSSMTLKYDAYTGWEPSACLVICGQDPSGELYAIKITVPKFVSDTRNVEYRNVRAVGTIKTDSQFVGSDYNISIRINGCPEVEKFVFSYTTADNDEDKTIEGTDINFNAEYIVRKNIETFTDDTDEHPESRMLNIVARCSWNDKDGSEKDSDYNTYSTTANTIENYASCGESSNSRIYRNNNTINIGAGFYKTTNNGLVDLSNSYDCIYDSGSGEYKVSLAFEEPVEVIGYHTFFFGKHYNHEKLDVSSLPDDDYYIGYDYGENNGNHGFFPGQITNRDDKKLSCPDVTAVTAYSQSEYTFEEAKNIKSIKTGSFLKIIGNQAFKNLTSLEEIDFEGSPLERIGMYAFEGDLALKVFNMPDTVNLIGEGAFKRSGVTGITMPSKLKYIEAETFRGCSALTEVYFDDDSELVKISSNAFKECGLTSAILPVSLKRIEEKAFSYCTNLASLSFNYGSSQLEYIGYKAFTRCSSLEYAIIPSKIIGEWAFSYCTNLASIEFLDTVNEIREYAFYYCSGLTSVIFGNGPLNIGANAFRKCDNLEILELTGGVTSVGERAFYTCEKLSSLIIGTNVTSIGYRAFVGCSLLTEINYEGSADEWGQIYIDRDWVDNTHTIVVHCIDGEDIIYNNQEAIGE